MLPRAPAFVLFRFSLVHVVLFFSVSLVRTLTDLIQSCY